MAKQTDSKGSGAAKPAPFDPKKLTIEQQKKIVELFLGYHPDYFLYEGTKIRFNRSRFEAEERSKAAADPKYDRKWFNGWIAKEKKW